MNAFSQEIKPGAYQTSEYLPALKGKRIGLFANHTATIENKHLVDTLVSLGINRYIKCFVFLKNFPNKKKHGFFSY
jgi:uncharacterized protein YbbC (DUF1343 family)